MDGSWKGFTLLEAMIVLAIIMILASVAIPNVRRSKMSANAAVAQESLHILNTALFQYWTTDHAYPEALSNLGSSDAQLSGTSAVLTEPVLAGGTKIGYSSVYVPSEAEDDVAVSAYTVVAKPTLVRVAGLKSFFMDRSGVIRAGETGSAAVVSSPTFSNLTMHIKNKDLTVVLGFFVRAIRQQRCSVPLMAVVLTSEGKIAQFSGQANRANMSANKAVRYLERGVYTLIREGRCRAIGIPFDLGASGGVGDTVRRAVILLEHQDGSAYRIQIPYSDDGSMRMPPGDPVAVVSEPRFFLRAGFVSGRKTLHRLRI